MRPVLTVNPVHRVESKLLALAAVAEGAPVHRVESKLLALAAVAGALLLLGWLLDREDDTSLPPALGGRAVRPSRRTT